MLMKALAETFEECVFTEFLFLLVYKLYIINIIYNHVYRDYTG